MQMNTLESANLNAETIAAMKKGAEALKSIHGHMYAQAFSHISKKISRLILPSLCSIPTSNK
jgi:charged multivesicular body protein 4A/B